MRPLLLRRLLIRQQQQHPNAAQQWGEVRRRQLHQLLRAAGAEGRNQGTLVLCCIALAAVGAFGVAVRPAQQQREQQQQTVADEELELFMPAEDFVAHGRRLNVRVSPWLAEQQQRQQEGAPGKQRGRRRPRPEEDGVEWRERPSSKYVIVGLGVTGGAALRALLACEPDAEVTVVEAGPEPVGFDAAAAEGGQRGRRKKGPLAGMLSSRKVTYLWGTAVAALDADERALYLSDGSRLGFGKCLLAVGDGRPRVPARFVDPVAADRVLPLGGGSSEERRGLVRLVAQGRHVTIVGSNWASVELASYLSDVARRHGWGGGGGGGGGGSVTLIFPESTPLARELPRYLSGLLLRRLERRGVEVLPHTALKYIGRAMDYELRALNRLPSSTTNTNDGDAPATAAEDDASVDSLEQPVRVYLTSKFGSLDGSALLTDRVVIGGESGGGGRRPPVRFAGRHGLEADARTGSLVVSHELMASSSVFVAGDAAHFPSAALGQRLTAKSADHAYHSGWVAGMNMAGRGVRYEQLPLFFGCVPRLGIRAAWVGACDGASETHGFWWRNAPNGGNGNGNGNGVGGNGRVARRRNTTTTATGVAGGGGGGEGGGGGGLGDRVKGAFSSIFSGGGGSGKKASKGGDNTSSALAAMNIGVGVGAKDSKAGRQLGLRRSTTVDRALLDTDAEALLAAAAEEEAAEGSATDAISFTPVNGTGLVFFLDGAGSLRGVLVWGIMPPTAAGAGGGDGDDTDDASASTATGPGTTTRAGLSGIDPVLCGVIERARFAVAEGVRAKTTFKYDMNSRPETLAALKGLALDVLGPAALEQLGPRQPLYTYTGAKTLSANSADEALFRLSNTSKAAADILEEAYEAAVKGRMAPVPGTNSVPFPFNRN